ncbi:hypothetical protein ZIOFF_025727 [Zingiber officinale]|uniref:Legume lectin domain-containing protein n=1 Tax=Zingiber officinale TaxID=94328 RepID=A0A8J5HCA3_ZINOF|nr:hypothetical protein ZIOFF_025727 [Zingiber officinale]
MLIPKACSHGSPSEANRLSRSIPNRWRTMLPEKEEIGFSAATGGNIEAHTILSWSFHSTLQPRKKFKIFVLAVSIAGAVVLILAAALGSLWFLTRRRRTNGIDDWVVDEEAMDNEFENGRGPKRFPYPELARATGDFSEEGKLGEGGFRSVNKGVLKEPKLEVAIKRVSKGSKQGRKEYMS